LVAIWNVCAAKTVPLGCMATMAACVGTPGAASETEMFIGNGPEDAALGIGCGPVTLLSTKRPFFFTVGTTAAATGAVGAAVAGPVLPTDKLPSFDATDPTRSRLPLAVLFAVLVISALLLLLTFMFDEEDSCNKVNRPFLVPATTGGCASTTVFLPESLCGDDDEALGGAAPVCCCIVASTCCCG